MGATFLHLQMNESALQCGDDRLGAIVDIQTHQNHAKVALNGGLGDAKVGGDLLVAFAADDEI